MPPKEYDAESNIKRVCLGREAHLGDLYDANTDTLCSGLTIFKRNVPQSLVHYQSCARVKCKIAFAESRLDRCRNFSLGPEQQISVLGLNPDLPLVGSANYLSPGFWNEGEKTVSLICQNALYNQKLDISSEYFKNLVALECARNSTATHAVVEIKWGSTSVTSLSFPTYSEEMQEIGNHIALSMLKAMDETIHGGYSTTPTMDFTKLQFFSDFGAEDQMPQSLDECAKSVRKSACSLQDNNGELKPLKYTLIPLSVLEKITRQTASSQQRVMKHDDCATEPILTFLGSLEKQENRLRKIYHEFTKRLKCFARIEIRDFIKRRETICIRIRNMRQEAAQKLKMYRLGNLCAADLFASLRLWQSILQETDEFFVSLSVMTRRLECLEKCERMGSDVITDPEELDAKLEDGEHFVFYTKLSLMDEKFEQCFRMFEKLCHKDSAKCILCSTEVVQAEESEEHEDHYIARYLCGDVFEEDVCRLDMLLQECNVAKIKKLLREDVKRPNPRARLRVSCPNSLSHLCCDSEKKEWVCYHCGALIDYGFNKLLYCDCGESDPFSALWYCRYPGHGIEFAEYDKQFLKKELDEVQKSKEFNILLLGETGSGKSTWINSTANYIIHDSLAAASQCELTYLIPSSFTTQTLAGEEKKITVGEGINESNEQGQSATQKPQAYTFEFNDALIRLIDVPGVCDTRGPEQDKKNFDLILRELQTITELHAICIFLTPDTSRLTLSFQYCITELLTHLHKSAAKNIVFCFTKTRQTFYRAGQTLPNLRAYLKRFEETRDVEIPLLKETMYFFDNEAFRLLCAIKNGVEFTSKEKEAYQDSWDKSSKETNRLLNYVLGLEPHRTREMWGLNEARRIISSMSEPLANISMNVATNLRLVEDGKREIELLDLTASDLEAKLYITQITLKPRSIDHPRTVCAGPNCIEMSSLPETGESVRHFKQICHKRCYMDDIKPDTFPDPQLKNCKVMRGENGTCIKCGCSWDVHLHRRHDQVQEEVQVIDKAAEALLKEKMNRKLEKQDVLDAYDRQIEILEERRKRITKICARFGAFLEENSILPYNDVLEEYLGQAISLAEQEAATTNNREKVDRLRRFLSKYKEELRTLKSHLAEGNDRITLDNVLSMKKELQSMNSTDCNIAEYMKVVEEAMDKHHRRNDQHFDPKYGSKKQHGKTIRRLKRAQHWVKGKLGIRRKKTSSNDPYDPGTFEEHNSSSSKEQQKNAERPLKPGIGFHRF